MKNLFCLCIFIILTLVSCNSAPELKLTSTPISPATSQPTKTFTPTNIPTRTPNPTATPLSELTATDVGLPWDLTTKATIQHMPCYVNTDTRYHAGDVFYFSGLENGEAINVVAPMPGKVLKAYHQSDSVGQNIIVETPFIFNGERVYYQIVHFSVLLIKSGAWLERGNKIGELVIGETTSVDPRGRHLLDFGVYHTNDGWLSVSADIPTAMSQYIPVSNLVSDDLLTLQNVIKLPICEGNPKSPNMIRNIIDQNLLRSCPNIRCDVLATIKFREEFEVLQYTESGWYKIKFENFVGWINTVQPLGKITVEKVPDFGPTQTP